MSEILVPLAVISFLILLNGLFVAAEFSVVTAPRTRIAQAAERGSGAARRVLAIQSDPARQNRYLATAQVGITIASLGLGMYGEHAIAGWLVGPLEHLGRLAEPLAHTIATLLAIGLLTYLHVVIGEMIPKTLAIQRAEETVLRLDSSMHLLERLFYPLVAILNGAGNVVVRLLGVPPADAHSRLFSPEELEMIVEESAEGGLIDPEEQLFIENILDLRARTVGQVMTPRNQVEGIASSADHAAVLGHICQGHHSRFPVFEDNLDQIVGILHVKDMARHEASGEAVFELGSILRDVMYVPRALSLEQMLIRFHRERNPIAVVVDEFGGTAGLVTLEDLVEEVVGEILDEFDQELPLLVALEPGVVRVRGDLLIEELNQLCNVDLMHPEVDSVGGLVMASLGRVAKPGDRVQVDGLTFQVDTMEGLAVATVTIFLPPERGESLPNAV